MEQVTRIGMDTSKSVFQLHGVDAGEKPILRRRLGEGDILALGC
ncbi:MAG: IS110 family transposase, partial [Shinella sp.]|nr:IS110 family transposase [Shinella sp.]